MTQGHARLVRFSTSPSGPEVIGFIACAATVVGAVAYFFGKCACRFYPVMQPLCTPPLSRDATTVRALRKSICLGQKTENHLLQQARQVAHHVGHSRVSFLFSSDDPKRFVPACYVTSPIRWRLDVVIPISHADKTFFPSD